MFMKNIIDNDFLIKEVVAVWDDHATGGKQRKGFCQPRTCDAFIFYLEGSLHIRFIDNKVLTVNAGQILYLPKNARYEVEWPVPAKFIIINFSFDNDSDAPMESGVYKIKNRDTVNGLFRKARNLWLLAKDAYKLECMSLLYEIYANIKKTQLASYMPDSKSLKIKKACDYIMENYANEINPTILYGMSDMTETHFRRLFKEIHGVSPVKFINALRIRRAEWLLNNSNLSITQISENCGYSDMYYFSRTFKANMGLSPTEYLKKNRNL